MTVRNAFGDIAQETTQVDLAATLKGVRTASGQALAVGNARHTFRDGFASTDFPQPEADVWTLLNDTPDAGNGQGHIVNQGGDSSGSSYLRISLSPFVDNSSVWLTTKAKFSLPTKLGWGLSTSQRILGQEVLFGFAEADDADATGLKRITPQTPTDVLITASGVVTSNVLALTVGVNHPFRPGDRVIVVGCTDTRLNVGPVIVTAVDATTISVPLVLANGTYVTGAAAGVRSADPLGRANNAFGMLLENATATNATMAARRNGAKPRLRNTGIATTLSSQSNTASYVDALVAASVQEHYLSMDECSYRSFAADGNGGITGLDKYHQSIPDEELDYRIVVRARNLDYMTRPVARILTASKAGSTTATFVTDRPHGLTMSSRIGIYGFRDQTIWANTPDLAVASVVDATTFTAVLGSSASTSITTGAVLWVNHGQVTPAGYNLPFGIQTIARVNGVLQVLLNTTVAGLVPGDYVHLWGMAGAGAAAYEGAYKVLRQNGATLELASPGPDVASITTGGAVIKRTDVRLHFVRILDHTRHMVEVLGGRASTDSNNAVPVQGAVTASLTSALPIVLETTEATTTLAASALYSGVTRDLGTDAARQATRIKIAIRHLAGIVPGSLYLEQSVDNANFYETWRCPIPSDTSLHTFEVPLEARYYRFRFQNGSIAQTSFLFNTRRTYIEGTVASEIGKTLFFPVTAVAGQAINAATTVFGPVLDLGANHNWDQARLFYRNDVADQTIVIEQSLDGTSWFWTTGALTSAAGSGVMTAPIAGRYVRARISAGANASTLSYAQVAINA